MADPKNGLSATEQLMGKWAARYRMALHRIVAELKDTDTMDLTPAEREILRIATIALEEPEEMNN